MERRRTDREENRIMTFGSLFSGIGGLDLGLERAGMQCRWQVEIDGYCRRVLDKHWPDIPKYGDIREISGRELEAVDLICGGFPCQPVSLAGKRLAQEDERWLWPEFIRLVRAVRPRYVLVENVPGLLSRGMGDVLGDLAASGYDTEWDCISAAAVGAPHLRYRVFIIARHVAHTKGRGCGLRYTADDRQANRAGDAPRDCGEVLADADAGGSEVAYSSIARSGRLPIRRRRSLEASPDVDRDGEDVSDPSRIGCRSRRTESAGFERQTGIGDGDEDVANPDAIMRNGRPGVFGAGWRGESADGDWWAIEPDVGRVAHGIPARVDRLRGLGNAVVPQVVKYIGRLIISYDSARKEHNDEIHMRTARTA